MLPRTVSIALYSLPSAVNAQRQGDENPNSSVVADSMKFLANKSCVYQIMDPCRHTATKYLNDEKTQSAYNNNKLFKRFNFITDHLYEVELQVRSWASRKNHCQIFHFAIRSAQNVGALIYFLWKVLRYRRVRRVGNWYRLSIFSSVGRDLRRYYFPREKNEWEAIRSRDCTDSFTANATGNFFQEHVVLLTRSMLGDSWDCLKKNSGVPKCCACVARPNVATIKRAPSTNSVARASKNELWKTVEMDPCQSIAKY